MNAILGLRANDASTPAAGAALHAGIVPGQVVQRYPRRRGGPGGQALSPPSIFCRLLKNNTVFKREQNKRKYAVFLFTG